MAQAIRQTTFVKSDGRIEIQDTKFPQGAKVEVIVILEENTEKRSSEVVVTQKLQNDEDDKHDEEVKASLKRALQDVKEGKTRPISELWARIDDE